MRICFVVDGRSAIALNWIRHFVETGHEVHLVSTYPCRPDLELRDLHVVPVGLSRFASPPTPRSSGTGSGSVGRLRRRGGALAGAASWLHYRLGAIDAGRAARRVRAVLEEIAPDLVHAMRIPLEGLVAERAVRGTTIPLLVSVWGNDFTLFARDSRLIRERTRRMLRGVDALHADCHRDIGLARSHGLDPSVPTVVLPGNGGVRRERFHPGDAAGLRRDLGIPGDAPVVANPRGFRAYVRNDTFFRAIPAVLEARPDAVFVGVEMAGNTVAEEWIEELGVGASVRLLPHVDLETMAEIDRMTDVVVSPSEHDGTPNTVLEAIACGAFPVVGDIESLHEWIDDGENGLFFDPGDPRGLAAAIVRSLGDDELRCRAAEENSRRVLERADYERSMRRAEAVYLNLLEAPVDGASRPVGG